LNEPHIEVKAWKKTKINSTKAKQISEKDTVIGVVTTAGITKQAKEVFDNADVAWVENFPESELLEREDREGS